MKNKILSTLSAFFMLSCTNVLSYETEDYIAVLKWEEKWNKVVSRSIENYIERGTELYPASFSLENTKDASDKIRSALYEKIGWAAMKGEVISGYRTECGDDLLDVLVEFYTGAELTQKEKTILSEDYLSCATSNLGKTMNSLINKIENFAEQEQEIIESIVAK